MRKKKNFATPLQNPTDQNQNDTNFLHDIESDFNEDEKLWGKLKDDLAKIVNGRLKAKLGDEVVEGLGDGHWPQVLDLSKIPPRGRRGIEQNR